MRVNLEFKHPEGHQDFDESRELEGLPRKGDEVLWTDMNIVDGVEHTRYRIYEVEKVGWSLGTAYPGSSIHISLRYRGDG